MISIVIPTYLEESAIEETVRQFSTLPLSHEVIVSDGRSPDRTQALARAAGARVVEKAEGTTRSPAHQRNLGGQAARGEWILFIDSTVRLPDIEAFLKRALRHFEDPKVVALALPQFIYPERATRTDRIMLTLINKMLRLQTLGSGKFVLVRKSAFDELHGFREELIAGEDTDFFKRLKKVGTVVFDASLPYFYAGRREHTWGWPKILWVWLINLISVIVRDKSVATEWTAIR